MMLVVDTNILIAALIKDSASIRILLSDEFEFICPDFLFSELAKHLETIVSKSGITQAELEIVIKLITEKTEIIPENDYKDQMEKSRSMISDILDVPFLALALAKNADGIWSSDKGFRQQKTIMVYSTKDLLERI